MKKRILLLSILSILVSFVFAQNNTYVKSDYTIEKIIIKNDTLIIISYTKSIKSELYESDVQASFLLKENDSKTDTLLFEIPEIESFELKEEYYRPNMFRIDYILDSLRYGKYIGIDNSRYQYSARSEIEHLKKGIFCISNINSSYTGGAHGYSSYSYSHYDFKSNSKFTFNDVFEKGALEKIHELFLEDIGISREESNYPNIELPSNYYFTEEGIEFYCGMYGKLFGYGGNYLGCHLSIPYSKLEKFIIKDSPIWRMIN